MSDNGFNTFVQRLKNDIKNNDDNILIVNYIWQIE